MWLRRLGRLSLWLWLACPRTTAWQHSPSSWHRRACLRDVTSSSAGGADSTTLPARLPSPPGPQPLPLLGNSLWLSRHGDLEVLVEKHARRFGSISRAQCRNQNVLFVADPELVRQVTIVRAQQFYNRDHFSDSTGGLVSANDETHQRFRRLLGPAFLSRQALEAQLAVARVETRAWLDGLTTGEQRLGLEALLAPTQGPTLVAELQQLALSIQYRVVFGQSLSSATAAPAKADPAAPLRLTLTRRQKLCQSRLVRSIIRRVAILLVMWNQLRRSQEAPPTPSPQGFLTWVRLFTAKARQVTKQQTRLLRLLSGDHTNDTSADKDPLARCLSAADVTLRQRLEEGSTEVDEREDAADMLSALLRERDLLAQDPSLGEVRVTDEEVRGLVRDVIIAGSDTTAGAVTMTMIEILRRPALHRQVVEEMEQDDGTTCSGPLLQACVKEALRLHPPAPLIFRMASQDCSLGGFHVASGTGLVVSPRWLGRDPRNWSHPDEFRPDRWLIEPGVAAVTAPHASSWLPFGAGPRACLGGRVSSAMVPVIVGEILARVPVLVA